ncbi:class C beta-lactamase [Pleionea sp. CnH1-48]|uniref:class C beta-lactamase n=1 Tax=Pleionea sp. CnH1-48 TaxID=2954494 RepID=UPI00209716F8|nr:class C beta-lactamase [Pleionea sp. CnH1-48]MCO7224879.1 beta-lactamase [Pleionea sp. CnH1-48]
MLYIKKSFVVCVALAFVVLAGGYSRKALAESQKTIPSLVNQLIPKLMNKHNVPGMAVALTHNDEDYFFEFGVQDEESGTAVTENTLFEIGSVSKLFTVTLAAKSEVRGRLSLDNPISTYLSELKGTPLGEVPAFHLATHTAGGFPLQLPDDVNSKTALNEYYRSWRPKHLKGSQRKYANPSIGLLGVLTANANKAEFTQLMEKELLSPVGLKNTYISVPEIALSNYAWGKDRSGKKVRVNPSVLSNEAYGIKITSRDLLRFLKRNLANANGSDLTNKAFRRTHTGLFDTGLFHQALVWEKYQFPIDTCKLKEGNSYKMFFNNVPVEALSSDGQGYEYYALSKTGSTNGFGAYVLVIPHENFAVLLLANKNYPIGERIKTAHRLMAEALQQRVEYCD